MKDRSFSAALVLGLLIGLGVAVAGLAVGQALYKVKAAERFVTVKGLAERLVPADMAIWPLTFNQTGNNLPQLYAALEKDRKSIRKFLTGQGFKDGEISDAPPRVTDYYAQGYTGNRLPPNRYKIEASLTLSTKQVAQVKAAMERSGELVKDGIVLSYDYGRGAEFLFTGLNQIKPAMIALATKNGRAAAEQFARDSGSAVGGIRRASQGLFTIRNRDANTPDIKIVRVVSTLDFFLVAD
ncbi:MAG: SIMPL domain-containing protein [Desulfarculaceae bacterium]|nr:SIMPL domain-containing protein [Desulfarculaceae bacterium]MCF8066600.1 SIMPL domain-containing protein [Desulfarculaceae bacterium]MCF8098984.1 SIMPL domain-containing protein [Desulfarculaceae bacterium]MCF8124227.1 SIMPL domain-containing protein [Desulfarculaceae bacterium]